MENSLVVGILNIVEDKLREFDLQIPDDDREDSNDPIVGYQYAELHDRIKEFLEEKGILYDKTTKNRKPFQIDHRIHAREAGPEEGTPTIKLYGMSVVNSEGYSNGTESNISVYTSLQECLDVSYATYVSTWQRLEADDVIEDGRDGNDCALLSKEAFEAELLSGGYSYIQLSDYHIQFEFFEREVELPKEHTIAPKAGEKLPLTSQLQSASQRAGSSGLNADPANPYTEPDR